MGNHRITNPIISCRMYVTDDGKYVVTETIITDKREIKYFKNELLPK